MKLRPILSALALAAMTATVPAQAANPAPIEGKWRKGNMEVEIRPCADAWCATVTDASDSQRAKARKGSGVELLGLTMIRDLRPDKKRADRYKGKVFIADRDMTVKGTVTVVSDEVIKVRGCAVLGIVCREREWVRTGR